jgi:hypothetical protein
MRHSQIWRQSPGFKITVSIAFSDEYLAFMSFLLYGARTHPLPFLRTALVSPLSDEVSQYPERDEAN